MAESSIYQLPTEMVDLVAEHLSLQDVCRSRLTCKQFEAALLETFTARLHARISDSGGFVIARPSLEHLVQLTQQVRLRLHKVQSFSIVPARFSKDISDGCKQESLQLIRRTLRQHRLLTVASTLTESIS